MNDLTAQLDLVDFCASDMASLVIIDPFWTQKDENMLHEHAVKPTR